MTSEKKNNYCDKDGFCTANGDQETSCGHYKRKFSALLCEHRSVVHVCLSPTALTAAIKEAAK